MARALRPLALLPLVASSCARGAASNGPPIGSDEWGEARARFSLLARGAPTKAYSENVRVVFHEPRSGRVVRGRGAVAVDPGHAARLVLVGPGGGTALDAWITPTAYRFAVPALDVVRRGAGPTSAEELLPVGFFRWYFLGGYDGELLFGGDQAFGRKTLAFARSDGSVVTIAEDERGLFATRCSGGPCESLRSRGGKAHYLDARSGVEVDVSVESRSEEPPDPEAFVDPDRGGTSL